MYSENLNLFSGLDCCSCGWVQNSNAYYPIRFPREGCNAVSKQYKNINKLINIINIWYIQFLREGCNGLNNEYKHINNEISKFLV